MCVLKRGLVGPRGPVGPPGAAGVPGVDGIDVSRCLVRVNVSFQMWVKALQFLSGSIRSVRKVLMASQGGNSSSSLKGRFFSSSSSWSYSPHCNQWCQNILYNEMKHLNSTESVLVHQDASQWDSGNSPKITVIELKTSSFPSVCRKHVV